MIIEGILKTEELYNQKLRSKLQEKNNNIVVNKDGQQNDHQQQNLNEEKDGYYNKPEDEEDMAFVKTTPEGNFTLNISA